MTIDGLIEQLQTLKQHGLSGTAVVKAYDGDSGNMEEVTGVLYDNNVLEFCTDED